MLRFPKRTRLWWGFSSKKWSSYEIVQVCIQVYTSNKCGTTTQTNVEKCGFYNSWGRWHTKVQWSLIQVRAVGGLLAKALQHWQQITSAMLPWCSCPTHIVCAIGFPEVRESPTRYHQSIQSTNCRMVGSSRGCDKHDATMRSQSSKDGSRKLAGWGVVFSPETSSKQGCTSKKSQMSTGCSDASAKSWLDVRCSLRRCENN